MISPYLKIAADNNKELLSFRPIPKDTLKSLREFYRVGLTYGGVGEVDKIGGIDIVYTKEAETADMYIEKVTHKLAKNKTLEESDILMLHRLFYQQIDADKAGVYRKVPVVISGSRYPVAPHLKIRAEMKKFVAWFNKNEFRMNPVEFAAQVHKKFVFIHPFVDGNGRVARLLMNLALLRGEYTIALIPAVRRMEYVSALEVAHIDDKVFVGFIADCVVATQADLLRLLRNNLKPKKGAVRHRETGENLSERILSEIRVNPGINTPALASMLNLSLRTTQRQLQALTKSGKIEFRGARKNGGYYLDG